MENLGNCGVVTSVFICLVETRPEIYRRSMPFELVEILWWDFKVGDEHIVRIALSIAHL